MKNKKTKTELNNNKKRKKIVFFFFFFFQIIKKDTDKKGKSGFSYLFKQYFARICFLEFYKHFSSMKKVSLNIIKTP